MNPHRPRRWLPILERLFALALGLFPASFRAEYMEEMRDIFRRRIEDASDKSVRLLFYTACKEAWNLPGAAFEAHAQAVKKVSFLSHMLNLLNRGFERGLDMAARWFYPKSSGQTPWPAALLSLAPFLLLGPLLILQSYHPFRDPQKLPWIGAAYLPVAVSLLVLGFLIGIWKKFPRWSYLYSGHFLLALTVGFTFLIYQRPFNYPEHFVILLLLVLLAIPAIYLLPPLRPFYRNIRQDWTLLSYTLYSFTFFMLSLPDMENSSVYNLQILLPSLIAWLGALAYLRITSPLKKVGALLGALLLGGLIGSWPELSKFSVYPDDFIEAIAALVLIWSVYGLLILAPVLLNISLRPRQDRASEL